MQKQDKILITGSSGMIGKSLCAALREAGYNNLLMPTHGELDLVTQSAVDSYIQQQKPAYIFHLAAMVGGIHANNIYPAQFIYNNSMMQANVIHSAHRAGVLKILFPGSACSYPKHALQPILEKEFLSGAPEITNIAYAAAKINGIIMAQSFCKEFGLNVVVPMPTNCYGIGDNFSPDSSHVIPALMLKFSQAVKQQLPKVEIWGSGKPLREFIYVDDVARAFIFLMQNYNDSEIINVGTEDEISIAELTSKIAAISGYNGEIIFDISKPDGTPRKCLNSSKLRALGFKPEVTLDEGLVRMYNYHFR